MRQITVSDGQTLPALEAGETGYVRGLRAPYGYVDVLATHDLSDPFA